MSSNTFNSLSQLNDPNKLVYNHLGNEGIQVVRTIYDNLQFLKIIFDNLSNLQNIQNESYKIDAVAKAIPEVTKVSNNLEEIITNNNYFPVLKELAPKLKLFTEQLEISNNDSRLAKQNALQALSEVESQINFLKNFNQAFEQDIGSYVQEAKNDIRIELETYLAKCKEIFAPVEKLIPDLENVIAQHKNYFPAIVHLIATDAVNIALYTKKELDKNFAYKKILDSESLGTDERILKERLNYRPRNKEVLDILAKNEADIIMKKEEKQKTGDKD